MKQALLSALEAAAPGCVRRDVPLSTIGRWRIGGPADVVVDPVSIPMVQSVVRLLADSGLPWQVIGEGSNLLFDSAGYRGVLVRIGPALSRYSGDARTGVVECEAGLWVPWFVLKTIRLGLAGCVHAIGIPGMLGGLVAMNGGSQRRGIGEQVETVTVVDERGALSEVTQNECAFAYRRSTFQNSGAIIVATRFRYERGDTAALRREAIEIMISRKRKFPNKLPNCGSVFVSDPALYATLGPPGAAIEAVGLKGFRHGGARISPLHANFIVNEGGARSGDVLTLLGMARQKVFDRTGITMRSEVLHLRPNGALVPAHESLDSIRSDHPQNIVAQ